MQRTCAHSWCKQSFQITDDDLAFYEKVSPVFHEKRELIPPPKTCPQCREQARWAFQNQRSLYRRTSSLTGKEIISAYSPEKPFPVYARDEWMGIDTTATGMPYDPGRSFLDQFSELFHNTPKAAVLQTGEMQNSEYTHFAGWQKNCYLIFDAGNCEDCLYGTFMGYNRSCCDVLDLQRNELCYDCVDLSDSYGLFYCTFCRNCSSSAYLFDCTGCRSCLGCINLRNKEYCVFNEQKTKEEVERLWREIFSGSLDTVRAFERQWVEFRQSQPHRAVHNTNAPNCRGDYLVNCEHAIDCYKCFELRDAQYSQYIVLQCNDVQDYSSFGENTSYCYQLSASGGLVGKVSMMHCLFNAYAFYGGSDLAYCIHALDNCQNCFGCCDIRSKRYCVLNRQYTQEEYERLVPQIIERMRRDGEWGEFFPITLSPFAYNESVAQDYFPLDRAQALERGFQWKERDEREYRPATLAPPNSIDDVSDSIVHETLACEQCRKNYRITTKELIFYRTHRLPVPRLCPDCRSLSRLIRRNPEQLWARTCAKCGKEIQTSYAPDRPEMVYCEECYLNEVY